MFFLEDIVPPWFLEALWILKETLSPRKVSFRIQLQTFRSHSMFRSNTNNHCKENIAHPLVQQTRLMFTEQTVCLEP